MRMRITFLLVFIFLINLNNSFGQNNFSQGVQQLCSQLDYEYLNKPYEELSSPKTAFIESIQQSALEEGLKELINLDFSNIKIIRYANLKSVKAVNNVYSRINYRQWEFETEYQAIEFFNILESVDLETAQFHINKGGLLWWHKGKSVFILTSRAFFVTSQYKEIQDVLIKEW